MGDKGYIIKRYSDGVYYFKDTTPKETEFAEIDDTIENPFEQIHLSSFPENDKNDKNDKMKEELLENGA